MECVSRSQLSCTYTLATLAMSNENSDKLSLDICHMTAPTPFPGTFHYYLEQYTAHFTPDPKNSHQSSTLLIIIHGHGYIVIKCGTRGVAQAAPYIDCASQCTFRDQLFVQNTTPLNVGPWDPRGTPFCRGNASVCDIQRRLLSSSIAGIAGPHNNSVARRASNRKELFIPFFACVFRKCAFYCKPSVPSHIIAGANVLDYYI